MRRRGASERHDRRAALTRIELQLRRGSRIEVTHIESKRILVIVCDVWDNHECADVRARLPAFAGRVDRVLERLRAFGMQIVHAPSDTMSFYAGTPQRQRAIGLGRTSSAVTRDDPAPPLVHTTSCGCSPPCPEADEPPWPWSRQHELIRIAEEDWISDDGEEIFSIIREVGAELVLMTGVHTNICVLDRPFGIRALWTRGFPVALVRDLTEAFPSTDTDEAISYIERWYCPSVDSADIAVSR